MAENRYIFFSENNGNELDGRIFLFLLPSLPSSTAFFLLPLSGNASALFYHMPRHAETTGLRDMREVPTGKNKAGRRLLPSGQAGDIPYSFSSSAWAFQSALATTFSMPLNRIDRTRLQVFSRRTMLSVTDIELDRQPSFLQMLLFFMSRLAFHYLHIHMLFLFTPLHFSFLLFFLLLSPSLGMNNSLSVLLSSSFFLSFSFLLNRQSSCHTDIELFPSIAESSAFFTKSQEPVVSSGFSFH